MLAIATDFGCRYSVTAYLEGKNRPTHYKLLRASSLTQIYGIRRYENGEREKLHNEEHREFVGSPNILKAIKDNGLSWSVHVARIEGSRSGLKMLTGKSARKRMIITSTCSVAI